jgi:hypothetical protein
VVSYAAVLLGRGYWQPATLLLAGLACAVPTAWRQIWLAGGRPRWLLLQDCGRAALCPHDQPDSGDQLTLLSGSFFLGRGALLVFQGTQRYRFWLDAGNVDPVRLAAIHRWLRVRSGPS